MNRFFVTVFLSLFFVLATAQIYSGKRLAPVWRTGACTVYNVSENQGVVIKSNDEEEFVIAYTDKGDFDFAMKNDLFRAIVESHNMENINAACDARTASTIKRHKNGVIGSANDFKPSVAPLLSDKWHQYYEPYNLLAPMVDSVQCVSGCVATAMAQVMHYWRYPEHGYGEHSYVDSLGCGQELKCDFSSHYYDWDNMLDNYEHVKYSEVQGYSVAQLMLDCGISVNMKYGKDASGASSIRQPMALSKYFGYDAGAQMFFRDFYKLEEWINMLKRELSEGRPVLISGYNYRLGHAFVCDGYDENDFFHFSFGNPDGAGDGFFYLPYLTPNFPPSQIPSDPESGFNLLQSIVTRVMPSNHPEATGIEEHVYAFSNIQLCDTDSSGNVEGVVVNRLGNVGWNLHTDSVALVIKHEGEIVNVPYVYSHDFLLEEIDDTVYTDTISSVLFEDALARIGEDGVYTIVPMFKDNDVWKEARTAVGTPNYILARVLKSKVSLSEPTESHYSLTLADVAFPDWLPTGGTPDYTITIQNGNTEFCGRIYIVLENVIDSLPAVLLQEQGLSLLPGEQTARRFHKTYRTIPEGFYNLRILYESDLFSGDLQLLEPQSEVSVIVSKTRPTGVTKISNSTKSVVPYSLTGTPVTSTSSTRSQIIIIDGKKRIE